jgi:hypothetical protein
LTALHNGDRLALYRHELRYDTVYVKTGTCTSTDI